MIDMLKVFEAQNCLKTEIKWLEIDRRVLIYVNDEDSVEKWVFFRLKSTSTTYDFQADAEHAETERCRNGLICSKYSKLKTVIKHKDRA